MPNICFPYPGNKARHSKWILEHIPEHECYVELFGGAAGVLFNKPRSKIEVYNDLNGDIPHFFRVLRDKGDELQEWLKNVPYSREVHDKWGTAYFDGERSDDDIERAGRFFTLRYTNFGGDAESKCGFRSSFGIRQNASGFSNKVDGLNEFRERLRGVEIDSADAFEVIERHDSNNTVFYADPPYEGTENRYNSQNFDHSKLAQKAKEIEAKIIISYDTIPTHYDKGFNVVSRQSSYSMNQSVGSKQNTQYLIMNYDIDGEPVMSELGQSGLSAYQ